MRSVGDVENNFSCLLQVIRTLKIFQSISSFNIQVTTTLNKNTANVLSPGSLTVMPQRLDQKH